jgi:hypothetical protein
VSANIALHAGHDVAYFTKGQGRGGCAGVMSYYTAAGEPPGEWAGQGAAALGLTGVVDPDVIERLYQDNTAPGGELLVKRRQTKAASDREAAAVAAYLAAHPYASATELAEVRTAERGKDPHQVPYFDLTISAVRASPSCTPPTASRPARPASAATQTRPPHSTRAPTKSRPRSWTPPAKPSPGSSGTPATPRTGHHSARTGEWRDGAGLTASLFLHHLSRDGDPQLHVHVAVWNRVQRADGAGERLLIHGDHA